jgi:Hydantoinase B/oxoprolinase
MRPQILFDPADVKKVLASLPTVAALIPDPFEEGEDSDAFSGVLRKTERELYRWIAHTHYDHLAEVVTILEQVHAAGCTFGNFLTTTSRVQFISHTAELLVAEDLLHRGFSVRTVPLTSEVSPDLHVTGNGIDVAVEVYSPRELEAVDEWVRVVNDLLNFMDVAVNYRSTVETRVERGIPPDSEPNSWMIAEQLQQTHDVVLAEISRDAEDSLRVMRPVDSGGAGERRGGLGIDQHDRVLRDFSLTSAFERSRTPPWGLNGGCEGRPNSWGVRDPDGGFVAHPKVTGLKIAAGSVVEVRTGGGGGFGDPRAREPEKVLADVKDGYVSAESAAFDYPHVDLSPI